MITVTKINDKDMVINCELIELIEAHPDTTITMTTGRRIIVKESVEEVVEKVIAFKGRVRERD